MLKSLPAFELSADIVAHELGIDSIANNMIHKVAGDFISQGFIALITPGSSLN